MHLVDCTYAQHAAQILAILNEAIEHSTALYDYRPRTAENMADWFRAKAAGGFPVIGVADAADRLLGFASYGVFRAWPAYKYSVEHSVYVHRDHRGRGLGELLLKALIDRALGQQYHLMIGGIDVDNAGSVRLHEKLGFTHAGTLREAGYKFGRWLDLGFYQLVLATPLAPSED